MLPVKHTVIYTFFAITSVQNTCFCSVFNALASKNPAKSCYVQCFFLFWPFFHCRKATKMTQNSISIPSCAQTPKNPRKMSKTPPYSGLGAKPFLAPPAKADIATAILTNVIEHLVLLFCPPISTPSPPKRCGRICNSQTNQECLSKPGIVICHVCLLENSHCLAGCKMLHQGRLSRKVPTETLQPVGSIVLPVACRSS